MRKSRGDEERVAAVVTEGTAVEEAEEDGAVLVPADGAVDVPPVPAEELANRRDEGDKDPRRRAAALGEAAVTLAAVEDDDDK